MALTIQTRVIDSISAKLPWLPRHFILPLAAAIVLVPALTVLAFSYGPMVSVQPEAGTRSGGASLVNDASASGGQSVKFGAVEACPNALHTVGGSDGAGSCWPYAGNTGPTGAVALTAYSGPCSIFDDTVIENKNIGCTLQMYSDASLTIRNSVVNGFIENTYTTGVGKLLIEDSEVHAGPWQGGALWGSEITANRVEVTGGQHSVHCESNCTITDSWLHNQYNPDGGSYHNNAFISNGGSDMVVRHNTLHCTALLNATDGGCTADFSVFGDFGPVERVEVDNNLFVANNSSAGYCGTFGYNPGKPYPASSYVVVTDNIFQRGPNNMCGVYGPVTAFQTSATGNVWTNNRWDDGSVLNP